MSSAQIVLVGGVLFILYKFLLKTIGVEQLGIWSLVLATTSVAQVANVGLVGGVVKYVAKYVARGEERKVSGVIQTAAISLGLFFGFALLAGYPLINWVLGLAVPPNSHALALRILPFALFSLWLTVVSSVFQSGLDGFQRIYVRNFLVIGGSVSYAILCFMFAPKHGLIGLAYAQVISNSVFLLISWILIKRFLPVLPLFPYQWNRSLFKEIIGYGISFQAITAATMLYDPTTKVLLSRFGGLSMVGYYEMASKMVQQFRSLIVSANQVLVPAIADLHEKDPIGIRSVYLKSYHLLFYLALPLFTLIIISTPLISTIWIGHYEGTFVISGILLAIGWCLNTFNAPSYIAYLGEGDLRWNVISHVVIGIFNAGLGIILGMLFFGFGVVVAWVIALIVGSAVICVSYHITHKIPLSEMMPEESRVMLGIYAVLLVLFFIIQVGLHQVLKTTATNSIVVIASLPVILLPFWLHPMRKRLRGWVNGIILNRNMG
jgi:O-antigen/teichoic acid export membrane protein